MNVLKINPPIFESSMNKEILMWDEYREQISKGDTKAISRCISLIENRVTGYEQLLQKINIRDIPVIGITGPPGAGKSTLVDALIKEVVADHKKIAVVCVDPSSAFTFGSLLGDRIRMNDWYKEPAVYIRSLSTRGSLGGLNPMIIEITDLLRSADFDMIIIETVGIGQSEIEISAIADITIVVLVPEAGDDIQGMKAGMMEIADIFVVNKSDRPGADIFIRNLKSNIDPHVKIPVLKTVASGPEGIDILYLTIQEELKTGKQTNRKQQLLANKAYHLIKQERMKDVDPELLKSAIDIASQEKTFNLYKFIQSKFL